MLSFRFDSRRQTTALRGSRGTPRHRRAIATAAIVCAGTLSGCAGPGASTNAGAPTTTVTVQPTSGPAEPTNSPAPVYDPADRGDFLLTGPGCQELTDWYAQFPADTDPNLMGAFVRACDHLPAVAIANPSSLGAFVRGAGTRHIVSEVLAGTNAELRAAVTASLAQSVCGKVDSGIRSLWQLQRDLVRNYSTTAQVANDIVAQAADLCVEHTPVLELFAPIDISRAVGELRTHINATYPDGPGAGAGVPDDELAALAQTACSQLADGDPAGEAGMLFGYFAGFSDEEATAALTNWTADRFCPQYPR